jgi:ATP-dependent helicase HrpB
LQNELNQLLSEQQRALSSALRLVFARHRDAVLQAPTGAGKSTLIPLALLRETGMGNQKILMLEPRRVAARAVAARMAALLGESVGHTVGYRTRLDTRVSRATRIEVVTEGVLTRMLQEDPALERVAYLLFDEFHERSLAADVGLALALDARSQLETSFRILIMSATLECGRVASLLGDAAVASVPGRAFPVDVQYLGRGAPLLPDATQSLERAVTHGLRRALSESRGDVLVFLPGVAEIRRVEALMHETEATTNLLIMPLHGDLPGDRQDAVLAMAPAGTRKVVLATNIAETSLTIPGVTAVVDAGLVRRSRFDPSTGMSRLEVTRISRAASDQRAGRAGRISPGVCYRLWGESAHSRLAPTTAPEIMEADLAPLALELARWGAPDASRLQWVDPPPGPTLQHARALLKRLDAVNERETLSALGLQMSRLPVHPRLAHMLLAACDFDAMELAAELAALLSERDVLHRSASRGERDPDIRTRLEALRGESSFEAADRESLRRVRRSAIALLEATQKLALPRARAAATGGSGEDLPGALLALAFPDRIGQRRMDGDGRYLLRNGRGARFAAATSLAREEWIVALELDDKEREARIDLAAPLTRTRLEELFAAQIVEEEQFGWDAREGAVLARRTRRLDALILDRKSLSTVDDERAVAAMLQAIGQLGLDALPWTAESRGLQARMEFVRRLERSELADWPPSDDAALMATLPDWLAPHLKGVTRREHLARVPLIRALRERLSAAQVRALESLAPRELTVPSGSQTLIDYLDESAPSVSVKLQEVFGLQETPRIGAGAVALTFKLLSPALRPVQITRDLAGFWRTSYAEVRKDMRGRYPKHIWPENPLQAAPTRRTVRTLNRRP